MNKESITDLIKQGQEKDNLYDSTYNNLKEFTECKNLPERILNSIEELLVTESWSELNDRFHSNLKFGTGGMRGRTIGNVITKSEKGENKEGETPEYAAVGSNTLNEITEYEQLKHYFYI